MRKTSILATIVLSIITIVFIGCEKQNDDENGSGNGSGNENNTEVIVTTYEPQGITETTALCGGDVVVIQQGLSLSGIGLCWSTSENPTINDNCISTTRWQDPYVHMISGLESGMTYHIRAFALRGLIVYYGEEKVFTTTTPPPPAEELLPIVSVLEREGLVGDGDVVDLDEKCYFGFLAESNANSQVGLSSLTIILGEENWKYFDLSGVTSFCYIDSVVFSIEKDIICNIPITAVVTDLEGNNNEATINVLVNQPTLPLLASPFEWIIQDSYGIGFEVQGLFFAGVSYGRLQIRPMEGAFLYVFDPETWYNVTSDVELAALFSDSNAVYQYDHLSANETFVYDDVIGTLMPDGTRHLIHITNCSISSSGGHNIISISGENK